MSWDSDLCSELGARSGHWFDGQNISLGLWDRAAAGFQGLCKTSAEFALLRDETSLENIQSKFSAALSLLSTVLEEALEASVDPGTVGAELVLRMIQILPEFDAVYCRNGTTHFKLLGTVWKKVAALTTKHVAALRGRLDMEKIVCFALERLELVSTEMGTKSGVKVARFLTNQLVSLIKVHQTAQLPGSFAPPHHTRRAAQVFVELRRCALAPRVACCELRRSALERRRANGASAGDAPALAPLNQNVRHAAEPGVAFAATRSLNAEERAVLQKCAEDGAFAWASEELAQGADRAIDFLQHLEGGTGTENVRTDDAARPSVPAARLALLSHVLPIVSSLSTAESRRPFPANSESAEQRRTLGSFLVGASELVRLARPRELLGLPVSPRDKESAADLPSVLFDVACEAMARFCVDVLPTDRSTEVLPVLIAALGAEGRTRLHPLCFEMWMRLWNAVVDESAWKSGCDLLCGLARAATFSARTALGVRLQAVFPGFSEPRASLATSVIIHFLKQRRTSGGAPRLRQDEALRMIGALAPASEPCCALGVAMQHRNISGYASGSHRAKWSVEAIAVGCVLGVLAPVAPQLGTEAATRCLEVSCTAAGTVARCIFGANGVKASVVATEALGSALGAVAFFTASCRGDVRGAQTSRVGVVTALEVLALVANFSGGGGGTGDARAAMAAMRGAVRVLSFAPPITPGEASQAARSLETVARGVLRLSAGDAPLLNQSGGGSALLSELAHLVSELGPVTHAAAAAAGVTEGGVEHFGALSSLSLVLMRSVVQPRVCWEARTAVLVAMGRWMQDGVGAEHLHAIMPSELRTPNIRFIRGEPAVGGRSPSEGEAAECERLRSATFVSMPQPPTVAATPNVGGTKRAMATLLDTPSAATGGTEGAAVPDAKRARAGGGGSSVRHEALRIASELEKHGAEQTRAPTAGDWESAVRRVMRVCAEQLRAVLASD